MTSTPEAEGIFGKECFLEQRLVKYIRLQVNVFIWSAKA
jgi:hypothetical protein